MTTTTLSASPSQHPFLSDSTPIQWQQLVTNPKSMVEDIELGLHKAEEAVQTITQQKPPLTLENTLLALENALDELNFAWGKVHHLNQTCQNAELRLAYNELLPKVTDFFSKLHLNDALWLVVKNYQQTADSKALTGIQKRFLDETILDFTTSGADLPPNDKATLLKIHQELSQLMNKFGENVLDATNQWELFIEDEKLLAGLPESVKNIAKQNAMKARPDSKVPAWKLTLHAPCAGPCLQYLDNEDLRKQVWEASNAIGRQEPYKNAELIIKILSLRQQEATLLGKKDFADLTLQRRMAKNGQKALHFIESLHDKVYPAFQKDIEQLELFNAQQLNIKRDQLQPWEVGYWVEKQRQHLFHFEEEMLRPYFPLEGVIAGMFQIAERIYSIRIVEKPTEFLSDPSKTTTKVPVWHPEVRYYEIFDNHGQLLGGLYTDWYPRESKEGGAWMDTLFTGNRDAKAPNQPHLAVICGNLTPPLHGQPALLTHHEVETIFHEFGHALHHIFGKVPIKSLNGTNVAWDFVELPSQIFENWCWEKESLDLFAKHYQTQKPIPPDLLQKLLATRNYMEGMSFMGQLARAKIDLELYMHFYNKLTINNLDETVRSILDNYLAKWKTIAPFTICQFSHIFSGGYAAGYYSYKWAEVLDADVFLNQFKAKGIFNATVGQAFKKGILEKGDSEPADKLFRDFMGRDPDPTALLRRSQLISEPAK